MNGMYIYSTYTLFIVILEFRSYQLDLYVPIPHITMYRKIARSRYAYLKLTCIYLTQTIDNIGNCQQFVLYLNQ